MNPSFYAIAIAVAALVLWRRTRSMYRPIKGSGVRLLLPLLFLLPCLLLLLNPNVYAPPWEWMAAAGIGFILSLPLIWTTRYEIREDRRIYAVKNVGFIISFLAIVAIRFLLREYIVSIGPETKAALFITVALGYIVPWRIVSYYKFRKMYRQNAS